MGHTNRVKVFIRNDGNGSLLFCWPTFIKCLLLEDYFNGLFVTFHRTLHKNLKMVHIIGIFTKANSYYC